MASELKGWSAQIDLLTVKTENAGVDVKLKYDKELDALRDKLHLATEKMKELKDESGDACVTAKETADNVWDDLRIGLADATSKFK
jgi:hypothetical protein